MELLIYKKKKYSSNNSKVGSRTFILRLAHTLARVLFFYPSERSEDDFRESFDVEKGGGGRMKDGRQRVSGGFEKSVVGGPRKTERGAVPLSSRARIGGWKYRRSSPKPK